MGQEQSVTADELTDSKRQPRLQRVYQRAASIRDRVGAFRAPTRSLAFLRGTRVIYYSAVVAMVGVFALVGAATLPTLFGYHTYAVNGGSMEPTLKRGSAAVTKPTSPLELEIGDVISRQDDGSSTLHRIVDITTVDGERLFITQGDQNRTPDVTPVRLAGFGDKVVYSVPYAAYILNFARSWLGRLILLGMPAFFVAITLARRFRSKWRERRSETAAVSPADNEGPLTSVDAVSETPPESADEPAAVEAALAETPPESEGEPVAIEAALPETPPESADEPAASEDSLPETPPETEGEPAAIEDSLPETPTESEDEPVAIEAALPDTPPETEDEPVAIEAPLPATPPESEDEPAAVEAALPATPTDIPDSPFPIEAALAAKANDEQAQTSPQSATPSDRPALRIVSSSDPDDDLPAFLIEQMKRRNGVGERTDSQQEAGEESVA